MARLFLFSHSCSTLMFLKVVSFALLNVIPAHGTWANRTKYMKSSCHDSLCSFVPIKSRLEHMLVKYRWEALPLDFIAYSWTFASSSDSYREEKYIKFAFVQLAKVLKWKAKKTSFEFRKLGSQMCMTSLAFIYQLPRLKSCQSCCTAELKRCTCLFKSK